MYHYGGEDPDEAELSGQLIEVTADRDRLVAMRTEVADLYTAVTNRERFGDWKCDLIEDGVARFQATQSYPAKKVKVIDLIVPTDNAISAEMKVVQNTTEKFRNFTCNDVEVLIISDTTYRTRGTLTTYSNGFLGNDGVIKTETQFPKNLDEWQQTLNPLIESRGKLSIVEEFDLPQPPTIRGIFNAIYKRKT